MIRVLVRGEETEARDPLEASVLVAATPRVGEKLAIWDGNVEVYVEVEMVSYPTWREANREPTVWLRREGGYTDNEWRDLFAAMREERMP